MVKGSKITFFSIKWKLTISFVLIGFILVGTYVFMAKRTFESDKISYIFDSEQAQTNNIAKQIDQRIERVVFDSRSIMAGFNFQEKKLNLLGQRLFSEQKDIIAIEVVDLSQAEVLLKLQKNQAVIPTVAPVPHKDSDLDQLTINPLDDGKFLISSAEGAVDGNALAIKILVHFKDLVPNSATAMMVLSQGDKVLNEIESPSAKSIAQQVVQDLSVDRSSNTMLKEADGKRFLVSSTPLKHANLRVTSVTDEAVALGALKVLFDRSIAFIFLSTFATIIISLLLSSGLTNALQVLTGVAEKISQGDFSSKVKVNTADEVEVLANAFTKMSSEIQRLLVETKDKARMESELMTAKLVQESLFPKKSYFSCGPLEINGLFLTSTECGGDWWYYFERGSYLYVVIADATGHGTPAALITCAARALFSQLERSRVTLEEMAQAWDLCIAECSNQQVMMTGLLLEINKDNGSVRTINASHELPILISKETESPEPVLLPVCSRLGEVKNAQWKVHEFQLKAGDRLVIYTDGLVAIANSEGKELGEKRAFKALSKSSKESSNVIELTEKFYGFFDAHRGQNPLPDDVTLVMLEWKKQGGEQPGRMAS